MIWGVKFVHDLESILHFHQEKCISRNGAAGGAAVFLGKHLGDPFGFLFAKAYLKEGAYHGAYHVAQEAVCLYGEYKVGGGGYVFAIQRFPVGFHYVADGGLVVGSKFFKAGKVLFAKEVLCGFVHFLYVGFLTGEV